MDISESVSLDIESLTLPPNKCSGSPKMTKALSRKGSSRMERRSGEEQEGDDSSKKLLVKVVCSQLEQLKQPFVSIKAISATPIVASSTNLTDAGEGKIKRFNRLMTINPRRILLLFASISLSEDASPVLDAQASMGSNLPPKVSCFLNNPEAVPQRSDLDIKIAREVTGPISALNPVIKKIKEERLHVAATKAVRDLIKLIDTKFCEEQSILIQ